MTDDRITRRDFLLYGGASLAGITLGELGRRTLARADERAHAWRERGVETWGVSVCRECPAACGIRVRLVDGAPVKLEGNPLCPVGRGRLCAKGQAALESYYDPDRLLGPARRIGKRGEGRWERITWEDATRQLAAELQAEGRPGTILAIAAEEHGPLADAWTRFWTAAGARVAWAPAATADRLAPRFRSLTGASTVPLFDTADAGHVLSFGAPIAEDWLSPVWTQRSYGRFRQGGSHARGRLVQVEGRRSLSARKADEWVPLPTDAHAALAFGLAAVLLREDRVDRAFLDEFGGNLSAFEREVISRYSPDDVAAATGIPVVTVLRLARELAAGPRPLVVAAVEAPTPLSDAVFALNALLGAFDRAGGIVGSATAPEEVDDATAVLRRMMTGSLRPSVLALRDAAALRALASPPEVGEALAGVRLVVGFSPFLDEAAQIADLLMPAPTSLESWHALAPAPSAPVEAIALAGPAVSPRLETRDVAGTLESIAKATGGPAAQAATWSSSADLVRAELGRLWGARRGAPYSNLHETAWLRQMERGGWWAPPAASEEEFERAVLGAGGWADPFVAPGQVRDALRARGGLSFAIDSVQGAALVPRALSAVQAGLDSLRLVPFTPAVVNFAGNPNQPALFELLGQPEGPAWRVWAELGVETARTLSLERGARIRIASPHGSVEAVAVPVEGMPEGTVALAFVPAVRRGGRWARLVVDDARSLLERGRFSGSCAVRVTRI